MLTSSVLRFRARQLSFAPLMLKMQPHSRPAMAGREPALHLLSIPQRHGSFACSGAGFPVRQWTRSRAICVRLAEE